MSTVDWGVETVRSYYRDLRDRAYKANPSEWVFIALLWGDWDKELAKMKEPLYQPRVVQHLVDAADSVSSSDKVALLEWLDLFPSAITNL